MESSIKKIVIVGGGSAGWMAASAFAKALDMSMYQIVLVESEKIKTVGVGEATIPAIISFNSFLRVDEDTFVRETNGTFKLGIEFVNWGREDGYYFHPYGLFGTDIGGFTFHHYYMRDHYRRGGPLELGKYNCETEAAQNGRFGRLKSDPGKPNLNYSYHFDAALYAVFLRKYAEQRGVRREEGIISKVTQHPENGYVKSVILEDGREIEGDLFIDCSGFRGLLIEQTLQTGYHDWSHWLPVNRAAALQTERPAGITPYTRATAYEAGWQWRIPLQNRIGTGYVFCNTFISEEEATEKFLTRLDGAPINQPWILRFTTGHRKQFWEKNVVAMGLAGGFLEPLESTSIHLIQSSVFKFLAMFPRKGFNPLMVKEYNRQMAFEYSSIRDFIVAHYKITEREDTPFWKYVKYMDIPETLQERLDTFKATGQVLGIERELFRENSWYAVLGGQGLLPEDYHPAADTMDEEELRMHLVRWRSIVLDRVRNLPSHEDFILKHCASDELKNLAALRVQ